MPPRKKKQKRPERFRCDQVEGERFYAQTDDVFRFNWWEVFCFPYILCSRFWDFCVSLFSGTNQCLVYWLMIQWLVCKITRITTPDPILFPYYFYLFCQVLILTTIFVLLWIWLGKSVVIPYFKTIYELLMEDEIEYSSSHHLMRLSFRRYCFRKGDIFETSFNKDAASRANQVSGISAIVFLIQTAFIQNIFNQ